MITLTRAKNGVHKFVATLPTNGGRTKQVRFGRQGYSDYTIHKDKERMHRYLTRHKKRENWTKAGRFTPGFWSRWLLWSRPSFRSALAQTQKVLGQRIIFRAK